MMKTFKAMSLLGAVAALGLAGCNYGNSGSHDHTPPPGMGSLILDDNTADDIAVYIDSVRVDDVSNYSHKAYDLAPGKHRLVLDQRGGDRNYSNDFDILADKLTVMDVAVDTVDLLAYDVVIFYD